MEKFNNEIELLTQGCNIMKLNIDENIKLKFKLYLQSLEDLNYNLTAIKKPEDIVIKHFLDSLSVLTVCSFPSDLLFCDLGTGAGFPLLPLKIFNPEWNCVFIDSRIKSINFVKRVCNLLKLDNIQFIHGHTTDWSKRKERKETFDVIFVRAFGSISKILNETESMLKDKGTLVLYKGPKFKEELEEAESIIQKNNWIFKDSFPVNVPFLNEKRFILRFNLKR